MKRKVMVDTSHLHYYIWDDRRTELHRKARTTINELQYGKSKYDTLISQLSIGEFKNTICSKFDCRDERKTYSEKLLDIIDATHADLVPLRCEDAKIAIELRDIDKRMSDTDAFILSQAITNKAYYLITSDKTILESYGISNYIDENGYKLDRRDTIR